jgi:hypothetical protein
MVPRVLALMLMELLFWVHLIPVELFLMEIKVRLNPVIMKKIKTVWLLI